MDKATSVPETSSSDARLDTQLHDADRVAFPLIERIVRECPERRAATESERRAQGLLAERFEALGLRIDWVPFRWNTNLYAVLALHLGLATLASAAVLYSGWLAFVGHALAAVSYWGDSTRQFYWLRRLFPYAESQNLVATLPSEGPRRLRVVFVAHADAAFTGTLFHPAVIRAATHPPPIAALGFMRKSMLVSIGSVAILALVDVALATGLVPFDGWYFALAVPAAIGFVLNAEVVLRRTLVPGANDNLSGCAGGVVLAERFAKERPPGVECVFVATGAEEAGTGGAYGLAEWAAAGAWSPEDTLILGTDGLSNGEMTYFVDGELVAIPLPAWVEPVARATRGADERFASFDEFEIPSGATDVVPFRAKGYAGVTLGGVDRTIGAPRHYHRPSDTPENLDREELRTGIDLVETFARQLVRYSTNPD